MIKIYGRARSVDQSIVGQDTYRRFKTLTRRYYGNLCSIFVLVHVQGAQTLVQ